MLYLISVCSLFSSFRLRVSGILKHTHSTNVSEVLGKITGFTHAVTRILTLFGPPGRNEAAHCGRDSYLIPVACGLSHGVSLSVGAAVSAHLFFASTLVICWQSSSLRLTQVCPVNVSGDPVMTFQLVLPLSSTSHSILPLCLLQPLPVSPFIMLWVSNPVAGMSLPSKPSAYHL